VNSKLDETYSSICRATHVIAFFGTPHQGGNHAKLGDIAATIARVFLRNPKSTFMKALRKDSLFADNLVQDFRHQLEDYFVLNVYETLPLKGFGLVSKTSQRALRWSDSLQIVDQKSATLGLPGTREIQIAMDADHARVCKFEKADGDDYEQVIGNIVELVKRAERLRLPALIPQASGPVSEPAEPICM
jgi:hypothetical protein